MAVLDSATQDVRSSHSHPWLARLVFAVDTMLRRHYAVVEYSSDPACIFRIEIDRADRRVALADGTFLQPGQRVARLHFWNEHIPLLPPKTGAMRWARHVYQSIGTSLHELARYLDGRPDLSDVDVICGDVPSGTEFANRTDRPYHGALRFRSHPRARAIACGRTPPSVGRKHPHFDDGLRAQSPRAAARHAATGARADLSFAAVAAAEICKYRQDTTW